MVDRAGEPDYKPALPGHGLSGNAQVAQLVEHATENRSVGGSIPPLGTTCCFSLDGSTSSHLCGTACAISVALSYPRNPQNEAEAVELVG